MLSVINIHYCGGYSSSVKPKSFHVSRFILVQFCLIMLHLFGCKQKRFLLSLDYRGLHQLIAPAVSPILVHAFITTLFLSLGNTNCHLHTATSFLIAQQQESMSTVFTFALLQGSFAEI